LKQGKLALAQEADELGITIEEIERGEVGWVGPADLLKGVVV